MNNQELQDENKKILLILKKIENKLDRELDHQKKNLNLQETQESQPNQDKIAAENIKSNDTNIKVLEK